LILLAATACNISRAVAEERVLCDSPAYPAYQRRVPWRMIPYLW